MSVLVTRPAPQGQALCEMLDLIDIPSTYQPLIQIHPGRELHQLPDAIAQADIVIAVSQYAVEHSHALFRNLELQWPTKTYVAIGQKTAHSLSAATQQNVNYPSVSDSEHFLELTELKNIENKSVLILRGNGGRELIKLALEERGAQVSYCETYQRQSLDLHGLQLATQWKNTITTIVITSGEQLQILMELIPSEEYAWLTQLYLVIPSLRIAQQAQAFGFAKVKVSKSASNQDIVTALQSIYRTQI